MTCPGTDELERFVTGDPSLDTRHEVGAHTASCDRCRSELSEIESNLQVQSLVRSHAPREAPAPEIEGYAIAREVGRGGMGVVYEARQTNPDRRVAIKVLGPSYAIDPRYERLFDREVRALARLSHPCIAAVYEAGRTRDGRPYLAMEFVEGGTLTGRLRGAGLSTRGRLELFETIAGAVAAAHQRGVIHRDLKPSNILVTPEGVPKVLDFGLAKLLESPGTQTAHSVLTEPGRIAGTLPYMSPEQARGEDRAVDTRSDVYALGVMLFEMLTGSRPYELSPTNMIASARMICETEPARPSSVHPSLRGDLDAIVLKALEKDPSRRYQTAQALSDDVRRFLDNQPVTARAPTLAYHARKLVARHPLPVLLTLLLAGVTLGLSVWVSVLSFRSLRAERRAAAKAPAAREEATTAWETQQLVIGLLWSGTEDATAVETMTTGELLDRARDRVEMLLREDPVARAGVLVTLGDLYARIGRWDDAQPLFKQALAVAEQNRDRRPLLEARTLSSYGQALVRRRDPRAADALSKAIQIYSERDPDNPATAGISASFFAAVSMVDDPLASEQPLRDFISLMRSGEHHREMLVPAMNMLAGNLDRQGRYEEALGVMLEGLAIARETMGPRSGELASVCNNTASLLISLGRSREAIDLAREGMEIRRATEGDDLAIGSSALVLGRAFLASGDTTDAEPMLRDALARWTSAFPKGSSPIAEVEGALGECLLVLGRLDEARGLLESSDAVVSANPKASARDRREGIERLITLYERAGDGKAAGVQRARLDALPRE